MSSNINSRYLSKAITTDYVERKIHTIGDYRSADTENGVMSLTVNSWPSKEAYFNGASPLITKGVILPLGDSVDLTSLSGTSDPKKIILNMVAYLLSNQNGGILEGCSLLDSQPQTSSLALSSSNSSNVSGSISATSQIDETLNYSVVVGASGYGSTITTDSSGNVSYIAGNAIPKGTHTESFSVKVFDQFGNNTETEVNVTATESRELAPVSVTEINLSSDGTTTVTGSISASSERSKTLCFASSGTSNYGSAFVIDALTGSYTYTPSSSIPSGASNETFTVTVSNSDGTGSTSVSVEVSITKS